MKTTRIIHAGVGAVAVSTLFGCATIFSTPNQEVSFHSNPDGATVWVGGKIIGKTPITTRLSRKSGQALAFEKDGYNKVTMDMTTRLNPVFWGNILIGGLLGSTTDAASGASIEYSPNQYMVTLNPIGTSRLDGPVSRSLAQRTTEFVVVGYDSILRDLQRGGGPYVASLMNLLGIPKEAERAALDEIHAISQVHLSATTFADRIVQQYL